MIRTTTTAMYYRNSRGPFAARSTANTHTTIKMAIAMVPPASLSFDAAAVLASSAEFDSLAVQTSMAQEAGT
jgi:hypothetical protein